MRTLFNIKQDLRTLFNIITIQKVSFAHFLQNSALRPGLRRIFASPDFFSTSILFFKLLFVNCTLQNLQYENKARKL